MSKTSKARAQVISATKTGLSRRSFLSSAATFSGLLGAEIVYQQFMPKGLIPIALAEESKPFVIDGKHPELVVLNDRPVNAETPAHLLDDAVTPADKLFVRNNGIPPKDIDVSNWKLEISGESVVTPRTFSLAQLKSEFAHHTYQLTIECGGNGRSEFQPPAKGNQWSTGAVGCPLWTGVRLADVLAACGVKDDAVYIGYYAADTHLSGDPNKPVISRGVPISKAMQDESLIAWAMNGEPLPVMNGYPLRLVFGGWPASTSGKWLNKIVVRNQVHDGAKMGGSSYRVPCNPVAPGSKVDKDNMCIIEQMPVKSLITFPKSGLTHKISEKLTLRGHAWAGDKAVSSMAVSIDFGQTWQQVSVTKPVNKNAWQHFTAQLSFPKLGYYEVWAKATDETGVSQPMLLPGWNPKGYLNNAAHRIAVKVV
ncbi:MAG: molybdopterin-dependent oxidoreductase [Alteromonadaceae bacterium]|nr:molybdopterin-dependent oxidoreductase [Alteromonadaceae bacterium]